MANFGRTEFCSLVVLLAVICHCSVADHSSFFRYQVDDSFSPSAHYELRLKRQVDPTKDLQPEKKVAAAKETLETVVTTSTPESKESTTSADGATFPPLFNETQQVDYDGSNVTVAKITQDTHKYYNSTTYMGSGMKFWVDFNNENVSTHDMLSTSHRRAATVPLTFDFPFYGHLVRNITIATGGFLYTGDYVHSWLAATQYIAPLMANFDTSMSNASTVKYMDNGTAFTVQWENVALQDRPTSGNFTFQATLLSSGDIIFAYKSIPIAVTSIADEAHPVKIGVSDAYIIDRTIFFVRRKTIYEYHKVDKKTDDVSNNSAIYFTALKTCISYTDCETCTHNDIGFDCVWCAMAGRCSDGTDRHRQDWLVKGCDKYFVDTSSNTSCSNIPTPPPTLPPVTESFFSTSVPTKFPTTATTTASKPWDDFDPEASRVEKDDAEASKESNVSSVVGILFLVALVVGVSGWIFYAYRNPHTPSGQCFIRYRPNQWRWRSGEAHYTAAAIHM